MSLQDKLNRMKTNPAVRKLVDRTPRGVKSGVRRFLDRTSAGNDRRERVANELSALNTMVAHLIHERATDSPRASEPKRLLRHGFKVYSQHDEDGITEEIFKRVGTTNKFFVEFGVGDGLENGTTYCLLKGWSGAWIDGSAVCVDAIESGFRPFIEEGRLKVRYSFITAENIEQLFSELGVPAEFDLLSFDIDNNDYWVWRAIERYSPRVVAIEYNASFKQTVSCVLPYSPTRIWDHTNYFGASLKALEELGRRKGYSLVGCNYTGVTAFFVRDDLLGEHFAAPYTAENHYEPPRYFARMPNGHPPGFGPVIMPGPDAAVGE
jgi:hypothetical protein